MGKLDAFSPYDSMSASCRPRIESIRAGGNPKPQLIA